MLNNARAKPSESFRLAARRPVTMLLASASPPTAQATGHGLRSARGRFQAPLPSRIPDTAAAWLVGHSRIFDKDRLRSGNCRLFFDAPPAMLPGALPSSP